MSTNDIIQYPDLGMDLDYVDQDLGMMKILVRNITDQHPVIDEIQRFKNNISAPAPPDSEPIIPTTEPTEEPEPTINPNEVHRKLAIIVAYALSRFNHHFINEITNANRNQTQTFKFLSNKLNVNTHTLKNYRDSFDPYVQQENTAIQRRGWWQRQLSPEFQTIKDYYGNMGNDENGALRNKIEEILE